jgi:predicted aconitase
MRAGELGPMRQWAIEHRIKVGRYLGAENFAPVVQAHIMADTESLGVAGVAWLERWASLPAAQRKVRIPTITDPRGTDFAAAGRGTRTDFVPCSGQPARRTWSPGKVEQRMIRRITKPKG